MWIADMIRNAAEQSASSLILDQVSGSVAAYGLTKLKSTATLCLRARRSSDSAEQDIGFSGSDLDTTSLLSFVGAGSGSVAKWYDQSGNSNDAFQTNAFYQPKIVNMGTMYDGIYFSGNYYLKAVHSSSLDISGSVSLMVEAATTAIDSYGAWIMKSLYTEAGNYGLLGAASILTTGGSIREYRNNSMTQVTETLTGGTYYKLGATTSSTARVIYKNGIAVQTRAGLTPAANTSDLYLMSNGGSNYIVTGYLKRALVFNVELNSTDMAKL